MKDIDICIQLYTIMFIEIYQTYQTFLAQAIAPEDCQETFYNATRTLDQLY